jgi:hypothetical protein
VVIAALLPVTLIAASVAPAAADPTPAWSDISVCKVYPATETTCGGVYTTFVTNGSTTVPSAAGTWKLVIHNAPNPGIYIRQVSVAAETGTKWTGAMCLSLDASGYATWNTPAVSPVNATDVVVALPSYLTVAQPYMFRNLLNTATPPTGQSCSAANDPYIAAHIVPGPGVDCSREWTTGSDGKQGVIVRAMVTNPNAGATDAVAIRLPWESTDRSGTTAYSELPSTVPQGGWLGLCKVTRTLLAGYTGATAWKTGATVVQDGTPADLWQYPKSANNAFVGAPAPVLSPWIAAPVVAAAATGWAMSGFVLGTIARFRNWQRDDEWFCRNNTGYRLARGTYCTVLMDESYQRSQTQFRNGAGTAMDTTTAGTWTTATAVAEVLIDPQRVDVGARTTTVSQLQTLTVTQQAGLNDAQAPDTGTQRATQQATDGTTSQDPRVSTQTDTQEPNTQPATTGDLAGGCNQSFWSALNPLNIAETMGCVLRKLFVPTDLSSLRELGDEASTKFPLSAVTFVALPGDALSAAAGASTTGGCLDIGVPNEGGGGAVTVSCSDGSTALTGAAATSLSVAKTIVVWLIYLTVAMGIVSALKGVVAK